MAEGVEGVKIKTEAALDGLMGRGGQVGVEAAGQVGSLTEVERQSLVAQGVQDVDGLVKTFGVEGVREMVSLDDALRQGEKEWKRMG